MKKFTKKLALKGKLIPESKTKLKKVQKRKKEYQTLPTSLH